jgi:enamine deaminase RidA (YjgF/YER057c/UK114 family)
MKQSGLNGLGPYWDGNDIFKTCPILDLVTTVAAGRKMHAGRRCKREIVGKFSCPTYNTALSIFTETGNIMSVYAKLKELNITLAPPAAPAAAYVMYVQSGNLVFLSGHIAKNADGSVNAGKLGQDVSLEQGQAAARSIAIDLVGPLQEACGGDLTRVKRIVKLMSLVNSTPDFTDQHLVTNGASELLGELFGDAGKHARSAFGVAQVPRGACVEIEMIVEIAG